MREFRIGRFGSGPRGRDAALFVNSSIALKSALAAILLAPLLLSLAFAESGADIYKAKCAACHGAKGLGDTMLGRNLRIPALGSPVVQTKSDDELITIISKGKKRMPSFERKLSRDQVREVLEFVRALKH